MRKLSKTEVHDAAVESLGVCAFWMPVINLAFIITGKWTWGILIGSVLSIVLLLAISAVTIPRRTP